MSLCLRNYIEISSLAKWEVAGDWCLTKSGVAWDANLCIDWMAGEVLSGVGEFVCQFSPPLLPLRRRASGEEDRRAMRLAPGAANVRPECRPSRKG